MRPMWVTNKVTQVPAAQSPPSCMHTCQIIISDSTNSRQLASWMLIGLARHKAGQA